jgi:L-rhamnose mutarotase
MYKTGLLRHLSFCCFVAVLGSVLVVNVGCTTTEPQHIKRVGMVVGIDPDRIDEYKRLHADDNPGVRDILNKYHIHNFSIFLQQMPDGKWYEFGYYEYVGDDFEGDMRKMDQEPRTKEWLKVCDPMQIPLPGAKGWTEMEKVYFNQ